jgi:hypothetical protein
MLLMPLNREYVIEVSPSKGSADEIGEMCGLWREQERGPNEVLIKFD